MSDVAASSIFAALGAELADARGRMKHVAALVTDHVRNCPPETRQQVLRDAQVVDSLAQQLSALAAFADRLSRGEPATVAIDAVPLADLADRLRVALNLAAPATDASPLAGDLLLFD